MLAAPGMVGRLEWSGTQNDAATLGWRRVRELPVSLSEV